MNDLAHQTPELELRYELRHPAAVAPAYGTAGANAFDLTAVSRKWVHRHLDESKGRMVGGYWEYETGVALEIPHGWMGLIAPRSSGSDYLMELANEVGYIDSDYRGTIRFRYRPVDGPYLPYCSVENPEPGDQYEAGDRIGQMVIIPAPQFRLVAQTLSETKRGANGYGHTGR